MDVGNSGTGTGPVGGRAEASLWGSLGAVGTSRHCSLGGEGMKSKPGSKASAQGPGPSREADSKMSGSRPRAGAAGTSQSRRKGSPRALIGPL